METLRINYLSSIQSLSWWSFTIVVLTIYNLTPSLESFDTKYYFLAGEKFWNGEIDCLRTPIYPLLLKILQVLFGSTHIYASITIFQSFVYLLSLISMRRVIGLTIHNTKLQLVLLFFYVSCIAPGWCNELTTESLSISGCIIITDLVFSIIYRPSIIKVITCHIVLLILVFLRPTFILFFAIFPIIWLNQMWVVPQRKIYLIALTLTICSIACFVGYGKFYERQYGKFGVSTTFVFNKIYDAHRGGYWDPNAVDNIVSKQWIETIDNNYDGTYDYTYRLITESPDVLSYINNGCDEMILKHKQEHLRYRISLFASSFDKRLLAAVNTHTAFSSILFVFSLFLSFPLSLFYLIVVISSIAIGINVLKKRRIPIIAFFIIITILAQTVGIVLTTSDAYERVLLPIYPLFVILMGMIYEKIVLWFD